SRSGPDHLGGRLQDQLLQLRLLGGSGQREGRVALGQAGSHRQQEALVVQRLPKSFDLGRLAGNDVPAAHDAISSPSMPAIRPRAASAALRATSVLSTALASSGSCSASCAKSSRSMLSSTLGESARTVARRGCPVSSAISPK